MKKLLFFVTAFVLCASLSYGQQITLGLEEATYASLTVGDEVQVDLIMVSKEPGYDVIGFDFFVEFDHAVLQWKGSNPNPTAGIINFNPLCPYSAADWIFNDNGVALASLWQDPTYLGANFPDGSVVYTMLFTYLGGLNPGEQTDLFFQTSKELIGTQSIKLAKGQTNAYHQFFAPFMPVNLVPGYVLWENGGTPGLWTGMGATASWFDGDNWDDHTVPFGIDVTIPAGTPHDPVIETDDILLDVAYTMNLVNDATITIMPFGFLSVEGIFTNNGSVMMYSDADNSASLIYNGALGGTFEYDRYLGVNMALPEAERGWHYISSMVPGFTAGGNINDYYLNTYDPATGWVYQQGLGYPNCTPPAVMNDGMDGWSVKLDEAYATNLCAGMNPPTGMTVEYMGAPNYGDQSSVLGVAGYQLVGNPYPSFWHYDNFYFGPYWPAGLNDAIYYWNEDQNNYASYVGGAIGINGGTWLVNPGQAFFFETTLDNVPLTFTPDEQVHVYGLPFYKSEITDVVKLSASANGFTDETVVHFSDNSTVSRDHNDALKFRSPGTGVPIMYTKADNIDISINNMPATSSVPVYFECNVTGTYTIEAVETSEFENVVLEDLFTGVQTDLLVSSHTFDHIAGADADRFILHFTPLGVGENGFNNINIWSSTNNIYVQVPEITGDIVVFNMMGQEVVRTDMQPGLNTIPMSEVNTYYIVRVISDDYTVTGKVYIK